VKPAPSESLATKGEGVMLVVRNVFRAKYGMGDALVQHILSEPEIWSGGQKFRVLTDASGTFFTVVAELTFENFAAFEAAEKAEFALPQFGKWFEKMVPLVDSGYREFWTIQHE
jgi:hypothetical protein